MWGGDGGTGSRAKHSPRRGGSGCGAAAVGPPLPCWLLSIIYLFYFLAVLHGLWDPTSLTGD